MKLPRQPAPLHDWSAPLAELTLGTPVRRLDGGTHRPLLCLLDDDAAGVSSEWVVKTASMFQGYTLSLFRELVGADVLAYCGLRPPRCGLLRLPTSPPRTEDSDDGRYAAEIFMKDAGTLAFCSAYVPAPTVNRSVFVHRGAMKASIVRDAVLLFAVERFLWHGDRTLDNPNCLRLGGHLVPVDHDRILHGLGAIDEAGCGPDLDADVTADWRHVAHELVRKHPTHPAWDAAAAALARLPEALPALSTRWPTEWDRAASGGRAAGYAGEVEAFFRRRCDRVVPLVKGFR